MDKTTKLFIRVACGMVIAVCGMAISVPVINWAGRELHLDNCVAEYLRYVEGISREDARRLCKKER